MTQLLQIFLLCCAAINLLSADVQLSCKRHECNAYLESVDKPKCQCEGPINNETTIEWTFQHDSRGWDYLGSCYGDGNCSTPYALSVLKFLMRRGVSILKIRKLSSRFSGILKCTMTSPTFSGSSSYPMRLTRIRFNECPEQFDFQDGSDSVGVDCDHSPYIPNTLTWTMLTHSGRLLQLGSCSSSENYTCTSLLSPNITLTGVDTTSTVNFNNRYMNRDVAVLGCSIAWINHTTEAINLTVDISNTATMENISLQINRHNWSYVLNFDITNAFSSIGRYGFKLFERFDLIRRFDDITASGYLMENYSSYGQYLVRYTSATDNKVYYRGRVVYSWPLSPIPGKFWHLDVDTYQDCEGEKDIELDVNISLPITPVHNCSDAITNCYCSTETLGSPAGRLLWLIGNTTAAVGDYGVKKLLLPSDNQTDRQDVIVATCQLDWIQPLTAQLPVILRGPRAILYKPLAIVGCTLLGVLVVFVVVFEVIWRRHQGRLFECSCKNSPEQEEDIASPNYTRLTPSQRVMEKNKGDEIPSSSDRQAPEFDTSQTQVQ